MFEYYPLIEWGYSNVTVPPSMLVSAYIHNLVQSSHNRGGEYQLILMFFHTYAILTYQIYHTDGITFSCVLLRISLPISIVN